MLQKLRAPTTLTAAPCPRDITHIEASINVPDQQKKTDLPHFSKQDSTQDTGVLMI